MSHQFQPHEFRAGESFDYCYEATEAKFTTEQVRDGRIPRVTDLVQITESRTRLRFTIVPDGDTLRKQVEFSDMQFREITDADLETRADVPFQTGQALIPRLPEVVTHVYDLGTDGRIASDLGTIFGKYLDEGAHPLPYRFIGAFTFAATVENFPPSMGVGGVTTRPAMDVDFYGARFHNHTQFQYFDRVDLIDGVPHAFIKVQSPGNYMDRTHDESAWLLSAHVPLEGPATGLVATGELQELVFGAHDETAPVSATQRQLSMTMQTDHVHTDGGNS